MQNSNNTKIQKFINKRNSIDQPIDVFTPIVSYANSSTVNLTPKVVHTNYHQPTIQQVFSSTPITLRPTHSGAQQQLQKLHVHSVLQDFHTPSRKKAKQKASRTLHDIQWSQVLTVSVALLLLVLIVGPLFSHVSAALASL